MSAAQTIIRRVPPCSPARAEAIRRSWSSRKKYSHTPDTDRVIRAAYEEMRAGDKWATRRAAVRLGWPKFVITHRAVELGLSRIKEKPWSNEELQLLERWAYLTPAVVARKLRQAGYERSANGIKIKLTRLNLKRNAPWYSATSLARAFGVDSHKVMRWIRSGFLSASRRETDRVEAQGGDVWAIHEADVRRFMLRHPDEYDLGAVEKWWFLDLLTEGKICR